MVQAVGWDLQKERGPKVLARLAVEESGIGVYEDKLHKIGTKTSAGRCGTRCGVKTCGLVEEDKAHGMRKYAKPIGVIANVVPCTNPESTVCCIGLCTLKTRNAIIVSPIRARRWLPMLTVTIQPQGAEKIGAPVDLLQCIREHEQRKDAGVDGELRLCRGHRRRGAGESRLQGGHAGADRRRRKRRSPSSTRPSTTCRRRPADPGIQDRQQRRILLLRERGRDRGASSSTR